MVRGRVGNPGRHGDCGFVRVRPQLRLLLPGRRIKCAFAATVSAPETEPNVVPFLGGGETSGASGGFSGKTERAGVWTVEGVASKPGEAAGSGRRGSILTPRSRGPGSTVTPSLGWASRKKPRPKKTTTVAVATTPREMR